MRRLEKKLKNIISCHLGQCSFKYDTHSPLQNIALGFMKNELGRPKAYWQSINCDEKFKALAVDGPAYKVAFFPLVSLIHVRSD